MEGLRARGPCAHSPATQVPTVTGGPQLGSVARPRSGSATSASVRRAALLLLSPEPPRGPEPQPHRSLPRYCGRPPVCSSCPATLFLFRHFLTGGPCERPAGCPVEDHRPRRRLPLARAGGWLGRGAAPEGKRQVRTSPAQQPGDSTKSEAVRQPAGLPRLEYEPGPQSDLPLHLTAPIFTSWSC